MANASERIPVLVTKAEKAQIAKRAKAGGVSVGEYLRRAAASFRPTDDDPAIERMIGEMLKSTEQANHAIDDALSFVEASNRRIASMEAKHSERH